MRSVIIILRYRKRFIPFALLSMALFRLPLWLNKKISFWKLLGCGQNGSFDKRPDWQQWGILVVIKGEGWIPESLNGKEIKTVFGSFIAKWIRIFKCETWQVVLEPLAVHGLWDGKKVFGELSTPSGQEGRIAILTRATIRFSRLRDFWNNVGTVSAQMAVAKGFVCSLGIGEIPLIKQATFSIWESAEHMKKFAYGNDAHKEVIHKTRKENWYSEEMFVRFRIISTKGTIKGVNPGVGGLVGS